MVAVLSSAVLILLFFASLGWITGHGQYDKVPEIVGKNLYAAKTELEAKGFKVIISDSVYTQSVPGLTVTKQIPEGSAMVKHGRTIYVTINRPVPPKIQMPSLIGFSYKSAEIYLQTMGLKLGDTTYRPDYAKNSVLAQLFNKEPIKPGTFIPLGSTIDFVLGSGESDTTINVPDVVGLTLEQAKTTLASIGIGIGSIVVVGAVSDSASAFVVRQNPAIFTEAIAGQKVINKVHPGNTMDLYIDVTKPVKDSTNTYPSEIKPLK